MIFIKAVNGAFDGEACEIIAGEFGHALRGDAAECYCLRGRDIVEPGKVFG